MNSVLVCLHGWGGTKESFTEIREALKGKDIEILTPDLPGFGLEPEPPRPWTVDDYAEWVEEWLTKRLATRDSRLENGKPPEILLLGHSHGGRIAMKLAARTTSNFVITHLYLCAAAGIRRPRHFKRIIGLTLAKAGKTLLSIPGLKFLAPLGKKFLYKLVRVHDYEKASPVMRETMIRVTKEDLRPLLHRIHVPTHIFWGALDQMTPVRDAYVIHRDIASSVLTVYPGVRHSVHRDRAREIATAISAVRQHS
jgi:pimeloyl-ACP methyl ester carboxylesterase